MRNRILIIVGAVVLLGMGGAAGYFFWKYNQLKNDPSLASQETTERLKKEVGAIYKLPTDEEVTIARVQDKEKLKDQPFFKNAEKDDYILIYTKAKLALLYRESERRLINVGPITISDTSQTEPAKTNTTPANNNAEQ